MQRSLTVIVPAFNEEKNLEASVREIVDAANKSDLSIEIIIIDDGSKDGTWECAQRLQNSNSQVKSIKNESNKGLGGTYKVGLAACRSEFITWVPADCSHGCDSLLDAYQAIGDADIIIPVPTNPQVRPLSRQIISRLFTAIVNGSTKLNIPYYNGLSVHKKTLLDGIKVGTDGFGFQAEIIVKLIRSGATYKLVNTHISERKGGFSKAFTLKNISQVLNTLYNFKK
jgi:glycosyltransferase involved in cell wall biosynthesis